jgi:ribosome-associated protein
MAYQISRSEKKRRAKHIESLVKELATCSAAVIKKLPCDDFVKEELLHVITIKGGAKKRQIKYITKYLRKNDNADELFDYITDKKGSKLKKNADFHELEKFRDDIISDVLVAEEEAFHNNEPISENWPSMALDIVKQRFPDLDEMDIRRAATRFAKNHKITYTREIFRLLRAAMEAEKMKTN